MAHKWKHSMKAREWKVKLSSDDPELIYKRDEGVEVVLKFIIPYPKDMKTHVQLDYAQPLANQILNHALSKAREEAESFLGKDYPTRLPE